jgi:hypothetical protein
LADTYLVTAADIAAELPGLFPGGFTTETKPTEDLVESAISTFDTKVTLHVRDATGVEPSPTDVAAPLARDYIKNKVIAKVLRIVYTGNDPAEVERAARPYDELADGVRGEGGVWEAITLLGLQMVGVGAAANRVLVPSISPTRELIVTDAMLDGDSAYRERRF